MKYAAFSTQRNDEGNVVPVERKSDIFDSTQSMENWWVTEVLDPTTGEPKDEYLEAHLAVYPVTDDGVAMEKMPDSEAQVASQDAQRLLAGNVDANLAVSAMITARQLYAFGLSELSRIIDNEQDIHDMSIEVLIQTAAHQAQEFDSRHMLLTLQKATLPWAEKVTETLELAEDQERKKIVDEAEAERIANPIPIGISSEKDGPTELRRNSPLLLAGDPMAVSVLLDRAQTSAIAARSDQAPNVFTVVRCSLFNDENPKMDPDVRFVNIPKALWTRSTMTAKGFAEAMQKYLYDHIQTAPDLLIIDDLPLTNEVDNGRVGSAAGEALKRVMDWCKEVGCGLVAGIPMTTQQDLTSYQWERVNKFSTLRPVSVGPVEEDKKLRRITVGLDAFNYVVHRDTLNHPDLLVE